jgi:hypothetical protein
MRGGAPVISTMKNMKIHDGAQGWEPGSTGLREQREGVNERRYKNDLRGCISQPSFFYAFPLFVPAAEGGTQP